MTNDATFVLVSQNLLTDVLCGPVNDIKKEVPIPNLSRSSFTYEDENMHSLI